MGNAAALNGINPKLAFDLRTDSSSYAKSVPATGPVRTFKVCTELDRARKFDFNQVARLEPQLTAGFLSSVAVNACAFLHFVVYISAGMNVAVSRPS